MDFNHDIPCMGSQKEGVYEITNGFVMVLNGWRQLVFQNNGKLPDAEHGTRLRKEPDPYLVRTRQKSRKEDVSKRTIGLVHMYSVGSFFKQCLAWHWWGLLELR